MKKLLAIVLAAVLLAGVLAGCGSSGSSSGGGSSQASGEPKELTFWMPVYQFGDGPSDEEFWTEKLDAFEAEHNCTVNLEILSWTDYVTTIYTGLLSGDGPDVVYTTEVYDLIDAGLLAPLDEYFTEEEKENYIYLEQAAYNEEGQLCTLPMMVGNACVMYFNMDILEAAGITELPTTWDELFDVCKAIKESNPNVWPFIQPWGASNGTSALMTGFWPYFFQAGGTVLDENGELNMDSEATLETLNFIKRMKDEGIFDDSITSMDDPPGKFVSGEAAIIVAGTGNASTFTENGINWQSVLSMEGSAGMGTKIAVNSLAISADCEEKELAAELIKYLTSASVMDDFHSEIYGMASVTKDATYEEPEPFQSMYAEHSDVMYVVPAFEGSTSFENTMMQNIQLMLTGSLTPEEVISETMTYYNEQIKS